MSIILITIQSWYTYSYYKKKSNNYSTSNNRKTVSNTTEKLFSFFLLLTSGRFTITFTNFKSVIRTEPSIVK